MSDNKILDQILEQVKHFTQTENIMGPAQEVGEHTIIPIYKISFGFGMGNSDGGSIDSAKGSGGGGGCFVTPVSVIVITDGKSVCHNISSSSALADLLEKIPDLIDRIKPKKKDSK